MSNQLEDDLYRVLRLARAQARAFKLSKRHTTIKRPEQRHRHDRQVKEGRQTQLTARSQGIAAIYSLDTNLRHLVDSSSKSVRHHCMGSDDEEVLQQRLDARRTLYKRHFAGVLTHVRGRKREMEHVLEAAAREARSSRATGVGIGAAVLTESQSIYSAGAIEHGALTVCAEQAAVMKMLSSASTSVVVAMAICSEQRHLLPFPCGVCRQLLADCGDFPVYLVNALGESEETRSSALFPRARASELTQILTQSPPLNSNGTSTQNSVSTASIPIEVKDWTTQHVLQWLAQDVELPQYCQVFEHNNVDGCTLVLLEASDLQLLLGITHPLHRTKLLTHVDRLRDRELLARGLDYTQLEDYLAVLDTDRVSAVAHLKTTFDRLDANHDGFLDFDQVKQALACLRCTIPADGTAQAVERLLHSGELFGQEAATTGNVSFPSFARAFSKLATQPADTHIVTQGAFAVHAFGPSLPVLDLLNLRQCFEQHAPENALDEAGLVRVLKDLGQSDVQSTALACRWLDAQEDESSDAMTFAQFLARYAQLVDGVEGAEPTGIARLQQLFTSYEPVHSTRRKPRTVVPRALSTLFPTVPSDEMNVWCASFWPVKVPGTNKDSSGTSSSLTFPEFTLACLEFAAQVYAREQEAASIKRSLRNDALMHRTRVVHLHSSGHVRMCPQPPSDIAQSKTQTAPNVQKDSKRQPRTRCDEDDSAERDGKAVDSDDADPRRIRRLNRREQQVETAFDRFARRHSALQPHSAKDDDVVPKSDEEQDESGMLNAVEAAQAALELGAALSREQVLRYLEREGLGRIRRRDISRTAFHRLMKRLDANRSFPRDLLLDIDDTVKEAPASPRKRRTASKSPRSRVYKSRPDYDEFLRLKRAQSNGTQWEKEVDALRRKQQRRQERQASKERKRRHHSSRHNGRKGDDGKNDDDGKHDSDSDYTGSTASETSTSARHVRTRQRRRPSRSRARSSSSETSTETNTSSTESTRSRIPRRRRGFESGARVASMVHGRGTVERVYRDYFVADVHFDSGRHLRNVEFSGLRLLDPKDEQLTGAMKPGFNVGTRVTVAHKGTNTRRQGKIVLCRTDGTFDILMNEFGQAQTLKRVARSALVLGNVRSAVYREGARVMVRQRTEYLRGKVCGCRTDGSYDVKLTRSPQRVLQRLARELLAPDIGEDDDSDDQVDVAAQPTSRRDVDDDFEPEFSRGDRVEARFGGHTTYFPGTIERVHPNGSCDITYDDGDEEERVAAHLIRALRRLPDVGKPAFAKKQTSENGYDSDVFDSD